MIKKVLEIEYVGLKSVFIRYVYVRNSLVWKNIGEF